MNLGLMKKLCSLNKNDLQNMLIKYIRSKGYMIIDDNPCYVIAQGDLPICLCAHMDTVFSQPSVEMYFDKQAGVLWSPDGLGADDRAGIYIIIELIERGYKPSIILTDLEEKGGIGADILTNNYKKCPFNCKALIELDRQGLDEAVYYQCDSKIFEKKINSYGFQTDIGTFTDISIIAPRWEIAAVNLSVGYCYEHSYSELFNIYACEKTIYKIEKMLKDCKEWEYYKFIPRKNAIYWNVVPKEDLLAKTSDDDNYWWEVESCLFCGKPLRDTTARIIPGTTGDAADDILICDECYKNYF